jgi:hypothetical protein
LVILLVKLTTVVLHHRGRTDFSKAQTATVVGIHYPDLAQLHPDNIEGGRASAAIAASRFGRALKISEDGLISCYHHGTHLWDM